MMPDSPRASIIINNYNYARYLGEAIDSALAQTYPHVEVIVVDDGSTDDSRQVIERYGRRLVPVLKENGGQGSTFNAGFRVSRGDVVIFLDADDTLAPEAAEVASRLIRSPRTVKVQWRMWAVDAASRRTGDVVPAQVPLAGDLCLQTLREGPLYDWETTPPTSGNAWARSFLERVFPMPEPAYRHGADVYLITLAPVYGRVVTAPQSLGSYRMHGDNNYCNRKLDGDRLRDFIVRFESSCAVLTDHLTRAGMEPDVFAWKERNFNYLWPDRLLRARQDIMSLVPEGTSYVLINNDEWGGAEELPGRRAIPFMEKHGVYWGSPPDDETALRELERLQAEGADFVAVWWTAFWLLDVFPTFRRRLTSGADTVVDNERIKIFLLSSVRNELVVPH